MPKQTFNYFNLNIWIWIKVVLCISILSGTTSALFLFSLQYVTVIRESNLWLIALLPIAGILIVFLYKKYGATAQKGNNLLLEEYYHPQGKIPWLMAPLILVTTLITHLFGGSAGREGTAVQYGGTYADRIAYFLALNKLQSRMALIAGVAAGFASLFGTPLAGTIFAIEVFRLGKLRYKAFPIVLITAYLSNFICIILQAPHTTYNSIQISNYLALHNLWIIPVAIACGLTARLFLLSADLWSKIFKPITNSYYKVIIGSLLLMLMIYLSGSSRYIGLGIPTILASFEQASLSYDFILKILFTTLTLSIGFKGGEVTPLFFIGATLTSFLSIYIPIPISTLAGLGFVAVFAGATKTPLACAVMALELFGLPVFPLALITTYIAVWFSGRKGIYSSQRNFRQMF